MAIVLKGMLAVLMLASLAGCAHRFALPGFAVRKLPEPALDNPLQLPQADREFVWNQLVDTIDDYFKIAREQRVRTVGGVLTEGRIDTHPRVGATVLEPWRRDSTPGFERLHSTLQSVRRKAEVRVMPVADGYSVEVVVLKELEDVSRPEHSTVGEATVRHDGTLVRVEPDEEIEAVTLGWIPLGRDISLEQQILAEIQARVFEVAGAH